MEQASATSPDLMRGCSVLQDYYAQHPLQFFPHHVQVRHPFHLSSGTYVHLSVEDRNGKRHSPAGSNV